MEAKLQSALLKSLEVDSTFKEEHRAAFIEVMKPVPHPAGDQPHFQFDMEAVNEVLGRFKTEGVQEQTINQLRSFASEYLEGTLLVQDDSSAELAIMMLHITGTVEKETLGKCLQIIQAKEDQDIDPSCVLDLLSELDGEKTAEEMSLILSLATYLNSCQTE